MQRTTRTQITEQLILSLSREFDLEVVFSLSLAHMHIAKIENLDRTVNLANLDLSENNIVQIEGLNKLEKLKKLNLGYNEITRIEGLENCIALEELHLEGNHIDNLGGLASLTLLPGLKALYLSAVKGTPNPVCLQPDYRAAVLRELPRLEVLDGIRLRNPVIPTEIPPELRRPPPVKLPPSVSWLKGTPLDPSSLQDPGTFLQKPVERFEGLPPNPIRQGDRLTVFLRAAPQKTSGSLWPSMQAHARGPSPNLLARPPSIMAGASRSSLISAGGLRGGPAKPSIVRR
ncbi:putative leucine-rich repeat and coiled-coil domain-containing protein 1 [Paratrimastix pyriformis]|uniref:Leucine-rich repeat and coiled-coil domain-containing protein 1 n=1 Tax=Paratrimastix pyriformis TaxID=342808 RepID=A0ABQ8UNZ0_9EUKA|nr:putative leucine-rich repeat and coiled-coil domain-containing protein 1 [Paratrimastix pyriformis]